MVEARRDFSFLLKFMKKKSSLPLFACMSDFVQSQVTHPSSFTGLLLQQRFYCTPCFNGTVPADEWKDCSSWIELQHSCSPRQDAAPWVSRRELELNLHRRMLESDQGNIDSIDLISHLWHWSMQIFGLLTAVQKIAPGYQPNWPLLCIFCCWLLSKVFPRPPWNDLSWRCLQRRQCRSQAGPPSCSTPLAARHWNPFLSRSCSW